MIACALCPLKVFALVTLLGPAGVYVASWCICCWHRRCRKGCDCGKKEI